MQIKHPTAASRKIPNLILPVVVLVALGLLSACDGGISGTGDGGPIITTPPTNTPTDLLPVDADSNTNDSDDIDDPNTTPPTPDLSQLVPSSLVAAQTAAEGVSVSAPFTAHAIKAAIEFSMLYASDNLSLINDVVAIDSEHFDNQTTITNPDSTTTLFRWSDDNATQSAFDSNNDRTIYLLLQNNLITLRLLDHSTNSLYQVAIAPVGDNSIIESTLNINGIQSYLQAVITPSGATVKSADPSNSRALMQREVIANNGQLSTQQTCAVAIPSINCESDSDWTTIAGVSNDAAFASANDTIGAQPLLLPSPVTGLSDTTPASSVLAATTVAEEIPLALQCGLQFIDNRLTAFCVQPVPLEDNSTLFEELLSSGEVFYQLIE